MVSSAFDPLRVPDEFWARDDVARIDLGIALVYLRSLDEAVTHGGQALSSARVTNSVLARAGELDRALMTRFPQETIAQDFHEQYRQVARQANKNTPDAQDSARPGPKFLLYGQNPIGPT